MDILYTRPSAPSPAGDANVDVALKVQPRRGVWWKAHTEAGRIGFLPSGYHLGRSRVGPRVGVIVCLWRHVYVGDLVSTVATIEMTPEIFFVY